MVRVIYEPDGGDTWHVYAPDSQGCRSRGDTLEAARGNIRAAIAASDGDPSEELDEVILPTERLGLGPPRLALRHL